MQMAGKQFSHLWNCAGVVRRKAVRTAYANGWQAVRTAYANGWQAVLPFMELHWMELHWRSSYRLWNCTDAVRYDKLEKDTTA